VTYAVLIFFEQMVVFPEVDSYPLFYDDATSDWLIFNWNCCGDLPDDDTAFENRILQQIAWGDFRPPVPLDFHGFNYYTRRNILYLVGLA
jgi:hypothetical protein